MNPRYFNPAAGSRMMESMSTVNRWITKLATLMNLSSSVVTECRRYPRIRTDLPVYLSGSLGTTKAHGIDMNRRGIAVHSTEAVADGSLVFLRLVSLGLAGFAHVRHCRTVGDGHILGLEFRDKLTRERDAETNWSYTRVTPKLAWDEVAD